MTAVDYAAISVATLTVVTSFIGGVRWLVKHFLAELKPNGGSSLKDSVSRLETRVEVLYQILIQEKHK